MIRRSFLRSLFALPAAAAIGPAIDAGETRRSAGAGGAVTISCGSGLQPPQWMGSPGALCVTSHASWVCDGKRWHLVSERP
jgi:hypothetical protein